MRAATSSSCIAQPPHATIAAANLDYKIRPGQVVEEIQQLGTILGRKELRRIPFENLQAFVAIVNRIEPNLQSGIHKNRSTIFTSTYRPFSFACRSAVPTTWKPCFW